MRQRTKALLFSLALAVCAPASVAAASDDEWNMTIEAERWSHLIGIAIVAAGGSPPREANTPESAPDLARIAQGIGEASARLVTLHHLTCRLRPIAKPADCAVFAPPRWATATMQASKDELRARLQWLASTAHKFVQPACAIAIKRTGDERFCTTE
ncbi:MAG: hypothetical protein HOP13_10975 [Alphaproteobacteria bacterium]|jgi:hypothetical protein|nr:hypothetical protein [Alphaproteobacteria bacterium]